MQYLFAIALEAFISIQSTPVGTKFDSYFQRFLFHGHRTDEGGTFSNLAEQTLKLRLLIPYVPTLNSPLQQSRLLPQDMFTHVQANVPMKCYLGSIQATCS